MEKCKITCLNDDIIHKTEIKMSFQIWDLQPSYKMQKRKKTSAELLFLGKLQFESLQHYFYEK